MTFRLSDASDPLLYQDFPMTVTVYRNSIPYFSCPPEEVLGIDITQSFPQYYDFPWVNDDNP